MPTGGIDGQQTAAREPLDFALHGPGTRISHFDQFTKGVGAIRLVENQTKHLPARA